VPTGQPRVLALTLFCTASCQSAVAAVALFVKSASLTAQSASVVAAVIRSLSFTHNRTSLEDQVRNAHEPCGRCSTQLGQTPSLRPRFAF
jgi:hypothetical protein